MEILKKYENNTIPTINIMKKEMERYNEFLEKQVVKKPSDKLLEIYEKRVLHELSYIRAEKYDSPEHQKELKELQIKNGNEKIPRNMQNPNYDKLMSYLQKLQEPEQKDKKSAPPQDINIIDAVKIIKELYDFMMGFEAMPKFELKIAYLNVYLDPRCFERDIELYMCYLLTKVRQRVIMRELKIFHKVTDQKFDDKSAEDSIMMLKDARKKMEDYVALANEFYMAMDADDVFEMKDIKDINEKEIKNQPEKCNSIKELIIYLYYSYS